MTSNTHTIASKPPTTGPRVRNSRWRVMFDECREVPGDWRRVVEPFAEKTAKQIASDIRSSKSRDVTQIRTAGLKQGEIWEAEWGQDDNDGDPDHWYIWLRYMGTINEPEPAKRQRTKRA